MMIRIEEYIREDGANPYKTWFDKLDVQAAAKVTVATMRLGMGNIASLKSLTGGLAELRIDWARACVCRPLSGGGKGETQWH